jgi:hypothetical protein
MNKMKIKSNYFLARKEKALNKIDFVKNDLKCKSLVIWGDNLYSLVGIKVSKNELNITKLPYFIRSVVIGLILSDGYIVFSARSKNGRLGLTQSLAHLNYLYFVFNILAPYCYKYPVLRNRSRFGKPTFSLVITTRSMPCITEIYHKFYIDKVKVIKPSIYNDLTPVAIAHWIMGDGTFNGISLLLCTDSYTIKEIVLLINVLIIKYDVHCTIRYYKQIYPRIYILKESLFKLREIILPYMDKSMIYKLGYKKKKRIDRGVEGGKLETYLIITITSVQIGYSLFTG